MGRWETISYYFGRVAKAFILLQGALGNKFPLARGAFAKASSLFKGAPGNNFLLFRGWAFANVFFTI